MLRVLLIVQRLLQENKHGSKRDIYYMHPSIFKGNFPADIALKLDFIYIGMAIEMCKILLDDYMLRVII